MVEALRAAAVTGAGARAASALIAATTAVTTARPSPWPTGYISRPPCVPCLYLTWSPPATHESRTRGHEKYRPRRPTVSRSTRKEYRHQYTLFVPAVKLSHTPSVKQKHGRYSCQLGFREGNEQASIGKYGAHLLLLAVQDRALHRCRPACQCCEVPAKGRQAMCCHGSCAAGLMCRSRRTRCTWHVS